MKRFFTGCLLGWIMLSLYAEPSGWSQGEASYQEGNFELALQQYESLRLNEGTSAALEYNIGNTLMRLNRIPEAMAHYRRAQWLSPHDPDIQANLSRAQSLQQAQIPDLPLLRRAAGFLPVTGWSVLLLASAWILGITGVLRSKIPMLRFGWVWILPAGLVLLILSVGGLLVMQPTALSTEAVARPEILTSRFEPLESATEHFSVTGGSVVEVLEDVRDWTRIQVDGKTGWVPTADLIPVGLPVRQG